jgi:hypothetical protein
MSLLAWMILYALQLAERPDAAERLARLAAGMAAIDRRQ